MKKGVAAIIAFILVFLVFFSSLAQNSLSGFVSTEKGAPLSDCQVIVRKQSFPPLLEITDSAGYFLLRDIPNGNFNFVLKLGEIDLLNQEIQLKFRDLT